MPHGADAIQVDLGEILQQDRMFEDIHSFARSQDSTGARDCTQGSRADRFHAELQAIVVTAAAPRLPQPLQDQLDDGGRIVIPVGGQLGQYLECWRRQGSEFTQDVLVPVAFVPLRGAQGWEEKEWEGY